MKVWRFGLVALAMAASVSLWSSIDAQEQKPVAPTIDDTVPKETDDQPMSFWMAKKLDYSKNLMEHLTKGDFDSLERDATKLRSLGKMEGLVRRKNPDYRTQLRTFDMAMSELIRHAKKDSAEGAVLAFNQMTTSCVACHVLIREGVE